METQPRQFLIVQVESSVGRDTYLQCGTIDGDGASREQSLYIVVNAQTGAVLDGGYRSFAEAKEAWPDAINRAFAGENEQ